MGKKAVIPWVLVTILAVVLVYIWADSRTAVKVAEERVRQKTEEVKALKDEIADTNVRIAKTEALILEIDEKAAAREAWLKKQLEKTNAATPQQLVDEGSRILEARDITTDGKTVAMGVETWRKAVKIFQSEEGYRLTKEPDWKERLRLRDSEIGDLKANGLAKDKAMAGLEESVKDLKSIVGKQKRMSLIEKLAWAAAGIGAGMAAEKIL